jgi:hypothetical protein
MEDSCHFRSRRTSLTRSSAISGPDTDPSAPWRIFNPLGTWQSYDNSVDFDLPPSPTSFCVEVPALGPTQQDLTRVS